MPIARDRYQSLELNPRIGLFISPDFSVTGGVYANYITQIHFDPGDENWGKVPKWIREMLFNPVDFGFAGGLRYAVNRFYVYGNAQYGLIPLVDFGATDINGEPLDFSGRNLAFQLGLGYTLIGKK